MGAGAEGEVRPCAWKWEWKLKSEFDNEEEGGPRSSKQQERRGREAERESAQGEWYPESNSFFLRLRMVFVSLDLVINS